MPKGKSPHLEQNPLPRPAQALLKSLCLGLFVLVSYYLFFKTQNDLAVACLGSSAFIVFFMHGSIAARERDVLLCYAIGLAAGYLCQLVLRYGLHQPPSPAGPYTVVACALAVLLAAFAMESLGLRHPPAAALSIIMVTRPKPTYTALLIYAVLLLLLGFGWLFFRALGKRVA